MARNRYVVYGGYGLLRLYQETAVRVTVSPKARARGYVQAGTGMNVSELRLEVSRSPRVMSSGRRGTSSA